MEEIELKRAHKHSFKNRKKIERSNICGCFNCLRRYEPQAIQEWTDDKQTARCPHCGIDSVIGSASGFTLDRSFLKQMYNHWFSKKSQEEYTEPTK